MKRHADVFLRQERMTKRVNITGLEKPKIEDIVVEKWQKIIDLTARIADVPYFLFWASHLHALQKDS